MNAGHFQCTPEVASYSYSVLVARRLEHSPVDTDRIVQLSQTDRTQLSPGDSSDSTGTGR